MKREMAVLACAALLGSAAGCKKHDSAAASGTASSKTTETPAPEPEPTAAPTAEQKVAFYQGCAADIAKKDWSAYGACYADRATSQSVDSGMEPLVGRDDIVGKGVQHTAEAFPDLAVTPILVLEHEDELASVYVMTGTQSQPLTGPAGSLPPSNKKIGLLAFNMARLTPGKLEIQSDWDLLNSAMLMGQLGLTTGMPAPPPLAKPAGKPVVAMSKGTATEQQNVQAVKAMSDAFNKHDLTGAMAAWAPGATIHMSAGPDSDVAKETAFMKELGKAVPDSQSHISDAWGAGDYVVAVMKNSGTNTGPMPSLGITKPTGKKVSFTEVSVMRFEGGKIAEAWNLSNQAAIAQQLGLMKGPGAGAAPSGK